MSLLPRQVIALEIQDLRSLYQREGVYTETIRRGLRAIIQLNLSAWSGVFVKEDHPCMSQNPLIEVLEANRLMQSPDKVARFEQTLETLAQNPDPADLPSLHLILDDTCEQPEVMFSLVHFLESFDIQEQVQAFIQVMPDLVKRAPEWTEILHSRIMNDELGRSALEERMRSLDTQKQRDINQLLSLAAQNSSEKTTKVA
ncbi:MAG: Imm30 family immunity protein [Kovacikia sp.]